MFTEDDFIQIRAEEGRLPSAKIKREMKVTFTQANEQRRARGR
jgi:hypothetical protein